MGLFSRDRRWSTSLRHDVSGSNGQRRGSVGSRSHLSLKHTSHLHRRPTIVTHPCSPAPYDTNLETMEDPSILHKIVPAPKIVPINYPASPKSGSFMSSAASRSSPSAPTFGSPAGPMPSSTDRPLPPVPAEPQQEYPSSPTSHTSQQHQQQQQQQSPATSQRAPNLLPGGDAGVAHQRHLSASDAGSALTSEKSPGSITHEPHAAAATKHKGPAAGPPKDDTGNPFGVDIVMPFDVSLKGDDRKEAAYETQAGFSRLVAALESEGGLRIATRPGRGGKGAEEVWVFIGASDAKVRELVQRERITDKAHGLVPEPEWESVSSATRLRLLNDLLTAPPIQHGLGITPGEGQWDRVKSIMALHDEARDSAWVERWTVGGDWKVGLLKGLGDEDASCLGEDQAPPVRLYFNFLSTYTMSLMPVAAISVVFWLFTPAGSYPPLYAFALAIYSTVFIAMWRVRERKLAVRWGMRGCQSAEIGRLRPQYVISHDLKNLNEPQHKSDLIRDGKMIGSIPVILLCGAALGCVLMSIFMLEAFVGQLWHGPGKAVVPLIPTALFSIVVPQVMAVFAKVSAGLVRWEDHPTWIGAQQSLTGKTFAMNAIVAYLGLYLSSYVYLPFGPYIMAHVQNLLFRYQGTSEHIAAAAHKPADIRSKLNSGRLQSQVFAYLVTNQVINTFLELGLPFILRYVNDIRQGKMGVTDVFKSQPEKPVKTETDAEKRFMDKVEAELALPEYNIFVDYAEMVTQFGYIVIWSIVWPLAPVFALINNYFELRSDALKISKHVRRPMGDRVETIGTWLDAMSIIAWMGAWTSATLIQLFRPSTGFGSFEGTRRTVASFLASYAVHPSFKQVVPTLIPIAFYALAASHGFFILRAVVEGVAERVFWRGSPEERQEKAQRQRMSPEELDEALDQVDANAAPSARDHDFPTHYPDFWNGPSEGVQEITRILKTE